MGVADDTYMCGVGSGGAAVLLSAYSHVRCGSHQFVFPCVEVLFSGTPPLCANSCKALSGHSVFISLTQTSLYRRWVRVAGCSVPQCQLIIEDVFRNATILHTPDIFQPSQYALSKQSVHTGKTSTRQDISVG